MVGRIPPLPSLRELIRLHDLRACKQLSQNFILDPRTLAGVVKCAGSMRNRYVLEVGPGPGGLTRAVLERGPPKQLAVVELDRRFLPGLEQVKSAAEAMGVAMDVYRQDILKFNTEKIFPEAVRTGWSEQTDVAVLGNLPFGVSTPLLVQWLHDIAERRGLWRYGRVPMTLTFQKEVGQRMCADIWDEQRSRLSIMCQALCHVEYKRELPRSVFVPRPEVDAVVMRLTPRIQPLIPVAYPYMEKLIKAAFQYRRKHLVRGLETLFPPDRPDLLIRLFREAGVQPTRRPIQVSILEFRDLCCVYERICTIEPSIFAYLFRDKANLPAWHSRKTTQRELLDGHTLTSPTMQAFMQFSGDYETTEDQA